MLHCRPEARRPIARWLLTAASETLWSSSRTRRMKGARGMNLADALLPLWYSRIWGTAGRIAGRQPGHASSRLAAADW